MHGNMFLTLTKETACGKIISASMERKEKQMGQIMGFAIWAAFGLMIAGFGVAAYVSKKPVGFWANVKAPQQNEITDVKEYNHAVAKLFFAYGFVFILLGLPLLNEQNTPWILISVLGVMAETIVTMVCYTLVIERKWRRRN